MGLEGCYCRFFLSSISKGKDPCRVKYFKDGVFEIIVEFSNGNSQINADKPFFKTLRNKTNLCIHLMLSGVSLSLQSNNHCGVAPC